MYPDGKTGPAVRLPVFIFSVLLWVALSSVPPVFAADLGTLLHLEADRQPLIEVLDEIASQSGYTLNLSGAIAPETPATLLADGQPILSVLKSLLRGRDYYLLHDATRIDIIVLGDGPAHTIQVSPRAPVARSASNRPEQTLLATLPEGYGDYQYILSSTGDIDMLREQTGRDYNDYERVDAADGSVEFFRRPPATPDSRYVTEVNASGETELRRVEPPTDYSTYEQVISTDGEVDLMKPMPGRDYSGYERVQSADGEEELLRRD